MELFIGRPTDRRADKETRVYNLLDRLSIAYQRVDHEAAMTMDICAGIESSLGAAICKNLLLCNRQQTDFYLLMLPGDKPFKTSVLSKQIGSSRLSFAGGEYMEQFLDITPGSLSVLGLMNDHENRVRLLIDRELMQDDYIGCHPCINTTTLRLKTADLINRIIPATGHDITWVTLATEEV